MGTGGESKEEEKEGQPSPLSGKMTGAIFNFEVTFQYILLGQAPKPDRCASRFALTPKKERLGHSGLGPPPGGPGRGQISPKSLFRT